MKNMQSFDEMQRQQRILIENGKADTEFRQSKMVKITSYDGRTFYMDDGLVLIRRKNTDEIWSITDRCGKATRLAMRKHDEMNDLYHNWVPADGSSLQEMKTLPDVVAANQIRTMR